MIRVLMCGPNFKAGGVATHTKNLTAALSQLQVAIITHNFSGSNLAKTYHRTFGLLLKAKRERNDYDIIHVQTSGGLSSFISAISGVIASHMVNKKLIVTFHYSETKKFIDTYPLSFKFVLKYSDGVILVSNCQKKYVCSKFPEYSKKIFVVRNGFDDSIFHPLDQQQCRHLLGLPPDGKIIFNISNLIENKGHKYLIDAMKKIACEHHEFSCYIAGTGHLTNELKLLIEKCKLDRTVNLIGWIPDEEIPIWMNACDLFVFPSLRESFGIVQLEALACGKPVVATRNGGSEDVIVSDDLGYLVEPADTTALAEKILLALDQNWEKSKILEYAQYFRWKDVAQDTAKIYSQILLSSDTL